jgi:hypothetical protein
MTQSQKPPESLLLLSEQALLKVGDRVVTPTGRTGEIVAPDADMPLHHLVLFDDDRTFWMLREILQFCPVPDSKSGHTTKPDTRRSHSKKKDGEKQACSR